jgi:epoxide hydrolase 4
MRRSFLMLALACAARAADIDTRAEHGYADSNGVKIQHASLGKGSLLVMIHGFPDFWYTWRNQMAELSSQFQTVAIDMRGYNLSDKPKGVDNYDMRWLVGDVVAVIKHLGRDKERTTRRTWSHEARKCGSTGNQMRQ